MQSSQLAIGACFSITTAKKYKTISKFVHVAVCKKILTFIELIDQIQGKSHQRKNNKLIAVEISLTKNLTKPINFLIQTGWFPNRAEFIRLAIFEKTILIFKSIKHSNYIIKLEKTANRVFSFYHQSVIIPKRMTLHITQQSYILMDKLVNAGWYPTRSEFIRDAIREKIAKMVDNKWMKTDENRWEKNNHQNLLS